MGNSPASPADSGSRTATPSSKLSQEKAIPVATANATAARAAVGPAWNRKPMSAYRFIMPPPGPPMWVGLGLWPPEPVMLLFPLRLSPLPLAG
jgi:hypothetical protein